MISVCNSTLKIVAPTNIDHQPSANLVLVPCIVWVQMIRTCHVQFLTQWIITTAQPVVHRSAILRPSQEATLVLKILSLILRGVRTLRHQAPNSFFWGGHPSAQKNGYPFRYMKKDPPYGNRLLERICGVFAYLFRASWMHFFGKKIHLDIYWLVVFNPSKRYQSNWIMSPNRIKMKNIWNHHPVLL